MSRISFILLLFIELLFANPNYKFEAICDKETIFTGEQFKVSFVLNFKDEKKLAEVNFSPPIFNNLHVVKKEKLSTKNTQSWIYTLSTNETKEVAIGEAYLDIAIKKHNDKEVGEFDDLDYDYLSLKTKPIFLKVKKGKGKGELFGEFKISSTVDKSTINSGENINLNLQIKGDGNLYDIREFKLEIPNTTIYSDKPIIKDKTFTQKFSILPTSNITIPSFELSYIDAKSKKSVIKKTKPIMIELKEEQTKPTVATKQKRKEFSPLYLLLSFIVGFISAFFIFKLKNKKTKRENLEFQEKIKEAKDSKDILKVLLLEDSDRYKTVIEEIEKDIYLDKSFKLTKKEILKKIDELNPL